MWPFRKRPPKPLPVRRLRFSLRSSFWLHALVGGFIVYECLMLVALPVPMAAAPQQIVLQAEPLAPPEPPPIEINAYEKNTEHWLADEAVDTTFLEQAQVDPRYMELMEDLHQAEERSASTNFLADQVMRSIAEAKEHSDEDQLERLKNLANQQNRISTQESVAAISDTVNKFLNTNARASAPAKEPVPGDFDFDTGQIHDMRREMLEDGKFKYFVILIDSAGRTQETELTAAEGESAYSTFELIKQNPLLERVYRGVVMSILDKVLKPSP